ncbi:MAG: hypothetical protein ACLR23_04010 [Clostridia bacterium]
MARVDCDGWVFALKEGRTGMIRQREQRNVPCTPFREARNRIRQRKERKDLPEGGVTIYLRGGTYRLTESFVLTEEDGGMPGREVRYQGYPGEEVRLCGSVRVNAEDFQVVSDSNTVARLRPQAVEHVRVIDLMEQGIHRVWAVAHKREWDRI